jgi:hypothetical protein
VARVTEDAPVLPEKILTLGLVLVVMVMALEVWAGFSLAGRFLFFADPTPAWGVLLGAGLGLVGPLAVLITWFFDNRPLKPRLPRIRRLEYVGAVVGGLAALLALYGLLATYVVAF